MFAFALLLRVLVGVHPHSGQDDHQGSDAAAAAASAGSAAPATKYGGDGEAKRHWMELTYHLPLSEWCRHDPDCWGVDCPLLTAYVRRACGWAAHAPDPGTTPSLGGPSPDDAAPRRTRTRRAGRMRRRRYLRSAPSCS